MGQWSGDEHESFFEEGVCRFGVNIFLAHRARSRRGSGTVVDLPVAG